MRLAQAMGTAREDAWDSGKRADPAHKGSGESSTLEMNISHDCDGIRVGRALNCETAVRVTTSSKNHPSRIAMEISCCRLCVFIGHTIKVGTPCSISVFL